MRWHNLIGLIAVIVCLVSAKAADKEELAQDEKTLRDARVATDGPGLIKYLKDRTVTEEGRAKLAATVRRLGDNSFKVREQASRDLLLAGRSALPFLRPALRDTDLEIVRRARRCIEAIESGTDLSLTMVAVRVLAARKPAGATEVLLAYLPSAGDDSLEEAIATTLSAVGIKDGKADAALTEALTDKEPARRAAAASVLGKLGGDYRKPVAKLLTDTNSRVRFQAAHALVLGGDKDAVPPLISILADGPLAEAWQAEDLLCCIAGERKHPDGIGAGEGKDRSKYRKEWDAWWKDNAAKIDLTKIKMEEALLGFNVIAEHDGAGTDGMGRIWECGRDGKVRWQITMNAGGPIDVQPLRNGRILVSEYKTQRVTERDRTGKVLWEHKVNGQAISCQRLPNGNTLIGTTTEILEVTRGGNKVFSFGNPGGGSIWSAQKLRNGHIVFAHSGGKIVEADTTGKEIRSVNVGGMGNWGGVQALPNGRFLVAKSAENKVVEVDARGKVHWEVSISDPAMALRLPNGNTIVSRVFTQKVIEFDRAGKEVWSATTTGRPFRIRRY
jgi:hypothetical protein